MLSSVTCICVCTIILCAISQLCLATSRGTKYYVTRSELKKRFDDPKKATKDPIHASNSNTYFVEDGYGESHELGDYADYHHDSYGYKDYGHRYMSVDKKHSKFFGDELSFVIVVVTLTVFFGILS